MDKNKTNLSGEGLCERLNKQNISNWKALQSEYIFANEKIMKELNLPYLPNVIYYIRKTAYESKNVTKNDIRELYKF